MYQCQPLETSHNHFNAILSTTKGLPTENAYYMKCIRGVYKQWNGALEWWNGIFL